MDTDGGLLNPSDCHTPQSVLYIIQYGIEIYLKEVAHTINISQGEL